MKKVWKSNDGKIFDSYQECLEYENRCGKKLKSNNILNLGLRNFKSKTNLKQFYKVEELRIKLRDKNEERSQAFQWLAIKQKAIKTGDTDLETYLKKYLEQIYSVDVDAMPLLTEDEELIYGKDIQKFIESEKAGEAYLKEFKEYEYRKLKGEHSVEGYSTLLFGEAYEELSYEGLYDEKIWDRFYTENDIDIDEIWEKKNIAECAFFNANLRLLIAVVIKHANENSDYCELIRKGSEGLIKAIEKFDPAKGYKFSHYAYWWIKDGIENQ